MKTSPSSTSVTSKPLQPLTWSSYLLDVYLPPLNQDTQLLFHLRWLATLDLVYNSPGIGDKEFFCKASLYLNLINPNNSLPLMVLDPSISNLLHLNQTNQLINQTTSRSHLLLAQEKLSKSTSVIRSAWAPIRRYRWQRLNRKLG